MPGAAHPHGSRSQAYDLRSRQPRRFEDRARPNPTLGVCVCGQSPTAVLDGPDGKKKIDPSGLAGTSRGPSGLVQVQSGLHADSLEQPQPAVAGASVFSPSEHGTAAERHASTSSHSRILRTISIDYTHKIACVPNHRNGLWAARLCRVSPEAVLRAAAQVPNRRLTTLAAGHSPSASRSRASRPRRRACVRDQSYDVGSRP